MMLALNHAQHSQSFATTTCNFRRTPHSAKGAAAGRARSQVQMFYTAADSINLIHHFFFRRKKKVIAQRHFEETRASRWTEWSLNQTSLGILFYFKWWGFSSSRRGGGRRFPTKVGRRESHATASEGVAVHTRTPPPPEPTFQASKEIYNPKTKKYIKSVEGG